MPARAGPHTREALKTLELSATAFCSSARPTMRYVSCWRAGASSTWTVPPRNAITYTCHASTTPSSVIVAIVEASTMCPICVPITVRRGSSRSTTTPANRLKAVNGRNCASASRPTASGDFVSVRISHACVIRCIHVPGSEIVWPLKKRR